MTSRSQNTSKYITHSLLSVPKGKKDPPIPLQLQYIFSSHAQIPLHKGTHTQRAIKWHMYSRLDAPTADSPPCPTWHQELHVLITMTLCLYSALTFLKMSKRPADTSMSNSDKKKGKHLCLSVAKKVKLLGNPDRKIWCWNDHLI